MESKNTALVDGNFKILRFEGKGGWHYVLLETDLRAYRVGKSWPQVKGTVDEMAISQYGLAPFGNGKSLFALNAKLRKQLKKGEGDHIQLTLFLDDSKLKIPNEIHEILEDYSPAKAFFDSLSEKNKKYYIDWIADTKNEETKLNRINKMLNRLQEGKKMYDI
jgi:hypothetical protein